MQETLPATWESMDAVALVVQSCLLLLSAVSGEVCLGFPTKGYTSSFED